MEKPLMKNLFSPFFSHIYVEEEARNYPETLSILNHFKGAVIIPIKHYKDVFCRGQQNFAMEKQSPSLILAVKKDNLIYDGSHMCDDFGNENFYYTSSMMNCIYNCEYCYLQGMYPSAHVVVFVNLEDIFSKVEEKLEKGTVYLCISYDTDILAMEHILGYGRRWMEFAKKHKNLKIELRTKSSAFDNIQDINPPSNIILAWTLSPQEVVSEFEHGTPSLDARLNSIEKALNKGYNIRLCFDPLLLIHDYKRIYGEFVKEVFTRIHGANVQDVSLGVFRVSKEYLKIMRKNNPYSVIVNYPFEVKDGSCSYNEEVRSNLINYVSGEVKKYIDEGRIFI